MVSLVWQLTAIVWLLVSSGMSIPLGMLAVTVGLLFSGKEKNPKFRLTAKILSVIALSLGVVKLLFGVPSIGPFVTF